VDVPRVVRHDVVGCGDRGRDVRAALGVDARDELHDLLALIHRHRRDDAIGATRERDRAHEGVAPQGAHGGDRRGPRLLHRRAAHRGAAVDHDHELERARLGLRGRRLDRLDLAQGPRRAPDRVVEARGDEAAPLVLDPRAERALLIVGQIAELDLVGDDEQVRLVLIDAREGLLRRGHLHVHARVAQHRREDRSAVALVVDAHARLGEHLDERAPAIVGRDRVPLPTHRDLELVHTRILGEAQRETRARGAAARVVCLGEHRAAVEEGLEAHVRVAARVERDRDVGGLLGAQEARRIHARDREGVHGRALSHGEDRHLHARGARGFDRAREPWIAAVGRHEQAAGVVARQQRDGGADLRLEVRAAAAVSAAAEAHRCPRDEVVGRLHRAQLLGHTLPLLGRHAGRAIDHEAHRELARGEADSHGSDRDHREHHRDHAQHGHEAAPAR
jgi:hypothetical protein